MKTIISFVLLLIMYLVSANGYADVGAQKEGLVLQGNILKALVNGKYKTIKRGEFYGYGWLDDHRIFIAFQQEGYAEAIVNAEVIDLRNSLVLNLGTIVEAHGESNFDVNPDTSEVVFNGMSDKTIVIRNKDGSSYETPDSIVMLMKFDEKADSYGVATIKNQIDCVKLIWIDDSTIGATLNDGHNTTVKISISRNLVKMSARKIYGTKKLVLK